jgi:hypothetical protein
MPTPHKLAVATLILMGLLLAGCDPAAVSSGTPNACDYDYSRLLEAGWKFYSQTSLGPVDEARDPTPLCVVLYQVDSPRGPAYKDAPKVVPVQGLVYRRDRNRPLEIDGYQPKLCNDMHLGERNVSPRLDDVLSGDDGQELIIEDRDAEGVLVQVSIFTWQEQVKSKESSFKSRGWFQADAGIVVEKDKVTTYEWWKESPRSKLVQRKVYVPRDKKSYHPKEGDKPEDECKIVDPVTVDLVPLVMPPDDQLSKAEYPEILVFAFYERLLVTDTHKLDVLMAPEIQASYWATDTRTTVYGCLVDPQLAKVFVQKIDVSQSPGIQPHIDNQNHTQTDTVIVTSLCRFKDRDKTPDKPIVLSWPVRWDWDFQKRESKWQLLRPTPK